LNVACLAQQFLPSWLNQQGQRIDQHSIADKNRIILSYTLFDKIKAGEVKKK
jgi:hypothetical protein